MSVTRKNHSITFTAAADAITDELVFRSLRLVGTGMTAGDILIITETSGAVLFKAYVEGSNCNIEFIQGDPQYMNGIIIDTVPAHGTFLIIARI